MLRQKVNIPMKSFPIILLVSALATSCSTGAMTQGPSGKFNDHRDTVANHGIGNYTDARALSEIVAVGPARAETVTAAPTAAEKKSLETLSEALFFGSNSAKLSAQQRAGLKHVADLMTRHPDWKLDLIGHADPRGAAKVNQALSAKRATSVQAALSNYGVRRDRMAVKAMGEISEANVKDQRKLALDRNVEIRVAN